MRGLRTLDVRVKAQAESAALLATRFANHACVSSRALSRPAVASRATPSRRGRCPASAACCRSASRAASRPRSHGRARRTVEARHVARRRRKPDRAPRLDRGAGLALPARPAAALGRAGGRGRSLRRSRPGAAGGEWVISKDSLSNVFEEQICLVTATRATFWRGGLSNGRTLCSKPPSLLARSVPALAEPRSGSSPTRLRLGPRLPQCGRSRNCISRPVPLICPTGPSRKATDRQSTIAGHANMRRRHQAAAPLHADV